MAKESLKVVVRLLPPEITEEEFIQTIAENHMQSTKWWSFHAGKRYKGEAKPSFNSRCYFQFETLERAEDFIKDYHGHQFVDGQGESFRAVACFAPYQKVPRQKPQKDPRDGTIEDDPVYKEFVESLSGAKTPYEAPPNPVTLLKPTDYGDTPLLNYLKNRSKERRGRLEKKDRKRWHTEGKGGLELIAEEEPKKPKWHCAECGTSKHLEEDPDDRGTFYCTYCWESWETQQPPVSKAKKKKKKTKDEIDEEEKEDVEKRRRKKHEKERDTTEVAPKTEWRAKEPKEVKSSTSRHHGDEDETDGRHSKKKKNKKDEEAMDESVDVGGHLQKNRWRVKKADEEENDQEWEHHKHRSRGKGGHKGAKDEWWTEPAEEKVGKHSSRRSERPDKDDKAEDGRVTRWRAKAPSSTAEDDGYEREEKPRRSRKERSSNDESSEYWVPKHR